MPSVKVCPKCGSENIKVDTNPKVAAGFSPPVYPCIDCGFSGSMFPEIRRETAEKS